MTTIELTDEVRAAKVQRLAENQGYKSVEEFKQNMFSGRTFAGNIGICVNPGCDFTTTLEPSVNEGGARCGNCHTDSVFSVLFLLWD